MKKLILLAVMLSAVGASFSQIKITKATQQKTFAGIGGTFMNYIVDLTSGKKDNWVSIDSIHTIANSESIRFAFMEYGNRITFGYALTAPEKCATCLNTTPSQYNLTKGIIIYGKKGKAKKPFTLKIKKFKQLPDLRTP